MKICGAVLTAILILGAAKFWKRRIFIIILASGLLCFAAAAADELQRDRENLISIEKNDIGEGNIQKELTAVTESGSEIDISISVPEKTYTESEIKEILDQEVDRLNRIVLGENASFDHICFNMNLPETGSNENVSIRWISSDPDIISSEGKIQLQVPKEGQEILMRAVLILQETEREYQRIIKVFPSEHYGIEELIQMELELQNTQSESDEYILPEAVGGEKLFWHEKSNNAAAVIGFLVLISGILIKANEKQKEEDKRKSRNEKLKKGYPELISRLLLMLYSGTGVRTAFFRMAALYNRKKSETRAVSEVFEEIIVSCRELENGSMEDEVYENLAGRCQVPCYKRLSILLIQNRKRGGKGFTDELEKEVLSSFAEKKRRAESEGSAASLKLLIPLGMMLVVVLALMMIPAFLSM